MLGYLFEKTWQAQINLPATLCYLSIPYPKKKVLLAIFNCKRKIKQVEAIKQEEGETVMINLNTSNLFEAYILCNLHLHADLPRLEDGINLWWVLQELMSRNISLYQYNAKYLVKCQTIEFTEFDGDPENHRKTWFRQGSI